MWPQRGEGDAVNTAFRFINEADESFIDGDQAAAMFVAMHIRVPPVNINIRAAGEGSVLALHTLW
jgi:hypothetical protein